jgi:hypothetical protein
MSRTLSNDVRLQGNGTGCTVRIVPVKYNRRHISPKGNRAF